MTSGEVGSQPHAVTGYVETAEVAWRLGRSRVPVVTALSRYLFSVLREGELTLYRGSGEGLEPNLLVARVGGILRARVPRNGRHDAGARESRRRSRDPMPA
jgi:hypothetical protein